MMCLFGLSAGAADSLFKDPIISVSPRSIDFGQVSSTDTVTNSLLVENWGGGKLVGKATVARPFKILSGASYRLRPADAQIVTITYKPTGAALDTNVVKFTGGGGAVIPVIGRAIKKER
jgi:hypothetical protein